jgi:Putative lumazine-binding
MNTSKILATIFLITIFPFFASISLRAQTSTSDTELVNALVQRSYFNGAYNDLDTKAMAQGFHADFAIFGAEGEKLDKYTIKDWIEAIEKRKAKPDFTPQAAKRDCKIISCDVIGDAAAVKVEIRKESKLIFTDYLSVLKFPSGWKIVGKVYQQHK